MTLTPLETDRLLIRDYQIDDLAARNRLTREAFNQDDSLSDTEAWLHWTLDSYRELARLHQPPYGDYAIALSSGEVIGSVGLVPSIVPWGVLPAYRSPDQPADTITSPEYGLFWAILPEYQNQGYATEAGHAFMAMVFSQLNARRVIATTTHDNLASQRVMHKLRMVLHGNPGQIPPWFEVVGVLDNPQTRRFYI